MIDLTPFPVKCPKCGATARYEHYKTMQGGEHRYGKTTFECGYAYERVLDEEFDRTVETEPGKCRRTV
jgi:hypothetical protein